MKSMIEEYAIEGRDQETGMPNGNFYLDKEQARRASEEVVKTHLHLYGQDLNNFLEGNFYDAWNYMNSADDGKVEAERMPTFFRMLCHDNTLDI